MKKPSSYYKIGLTVAGTTLLGLYLFSNPKPINDLNTEKSTTSRNSVASTKSLEQRVISLETEDESFKSRDRETEQRTQQEGSLEKTYKEEWDKVLLDSSINKFYTREGFFDYIASTIRKTKDLKLEVFLDDIEKADPETQQFLEDLYGSKQDLDYAKSRLELNKNLTTSEYLGEKDLEEVALELWERNGMSKNWNQYRNENTLSDIISNYGFIKHSIKGASLNSYANGFLDLAISECRITPYTKEQRDAITIATQKYDQDPTTENENEVYRLLKRPTDVNPFKEISNALKHRGNGIRDAYILGAYMGR